MARCCRARRRRLGGIRFGNLPLRNHSQANLAACALISDLEADSWTLMNPQTKPSTRQWHNLAYDIQSDRGILFGGMTDPGGMALGDTWAYDYDSDAWAQLAPAVSPAARFYADMAYDAVGDRIILHGGTDRDGTATLDDTWAYDYDSNAWTRIEGPGPGDGQAKIRGRVDPTR